MRTIIVTSTKPFTGKSGIAVTLIDLLADRGLDVGYFKPYGTMPVTVDGVLTDEDAAYINPRLHRPSALPDVCPVVRSQAMIEHVLGGDGPSVSGRVVDAFAACSRDRDVMVVEGPTEPAQGTSVGLSATAVADLLNAPVLLIDRPRPTDLPEDALHVAAQLGTRLAGLVLNGVHEEHLSMTRDRVVPFLESRGARVFGVLPYDPPLGSVTVDEIVDALGGRVLSGHENLDRPVESFMVGAMGQEKALRFFRRKANKAVITGGDRADVQMAALETSTECIILTGNMPPSQPVLARAEDLGVPMVLVDTDTLTAVERTETLLGRVHLHDAAKAVRIRGIFEREVDVPALLASVGL